MSFVVEFPAMRRDIEDAVRAFADKSLQSRWGHMDRNAGVFDDLTLNVNILYDCHVFPDPTSAIGAAIAEHEAEPLASLFARLKPLLDDLGERPDSDYLADSRWPEVVEAASHALLAIQGTDADGKP